MVDIVHGVCVDLVELVTFGSNTGLVVFLVLSQLELSSAVRVPSEVGIPLHPGAEVMGVFGFKQVPVSETASSMLVYNKND